MNSSIGKGDLAYEALKGRREPDLAGAMDDLAVLHAYGALVGVAEILRERRRQVEKLGYTPEHDDGHAAGLTDLAEYRIRLVRTSRAAGTADIGSDEGGLRKAGALCAAEMDRVYRLVARQVQRGERHPELGIITPDMRGG